MDINFQCPQCDQQMVIDESCAGFLMKCVRCGTPVTIPTPQLAGVVDAAGDADALLPATGIEPTKLPPASDGIDPVQALRNAVRSRPLDEGGTPRAPIWTWAMAGVAAVGLMAVAYYWWRDAVPPGSHASSHTEAPAPKSLFEPSNAPPPIQTASEPAAPVVSALPSAWPKAVQAVTGEIQRINAVGKSETSREEHLRRLIALADAADEMLRMVEESDALKNDPHAQRVCKLASDIFFLHNQAAEKWEEEVALRAQKDAVKVAHRERLAAGLHGEALQKGIAETTALMNDITADVMAAINARYDLWLQAQKQAEQIEPLVARWVENR